MHALVRWCMCVGLCMDMCIGMCANMGVDMSIDRCKDVCIVRQEFLLNPLRFGDMFSGASLDFGRCSSRLLSLLTQCPIGEDEANRVLALFVYYGLYRWLPALGFGPWALGFGPWALGLGPWALGLLAVAQGHSLHPTFLHSLPSPPHGLVPSQSLSFVFHPTPPRCALHALPRRISRAACPTDRYFCRGCGSLPLRCGR